ncbi:30S ribosomal protein S20, partial [Xylella fastidiosa]|nr:30S ribosomal protein S20 [Xylella fastidiosa]
MKIIIIGLIFHQWISEESISVANIKSAKKRVKQTVVRN